MPRLTCLLALLLAAVGLPAARAVLTDGAAITTAPTDADISGWTAGWGAAGITGWDYVGSVNGGISAVYLGNGWVLTAGHGGPGNFHLGGAIYTYAADSARSFTSAAGTADLSLFRIETMPTLPALTIRTADPAAESLTATGSRVVMIGNGGGKSWGVSTVTTVNLEVTNPRTSTENFVTTDFGAANGMRRYGLKTINNRSALTGGDSGGPDFILNSATGQWELAGINHAVGTAPNGSTTSFYVQLNHYAPQIGAFTAVPEPRLTAAAIALGLGALALVRHRRKKILGHR